MNVTQRTRYTSLGPLVVRVPFSLRCWRFCWGTRASENSPKFPALSPAKPPAKQAMFPSLYSTNLNSSFLSLSVSASTGEDIKSMLIFPGGCTTHTGFYTIPYRKYNQSECRETVVYSTILYSNFP